MKYSILVFFYLFSTPSFASDSFEYPFDEIVRYIVKHAPYQREWNGEDFLYTPLYHNNISPPKVRLVTDAEMAVLAEDTSGVIGLYESDCATMFLNKDIDPDSKEGYSIILHELVHHMQFKMGITDSTKCPASLEYDAYRIQLLYLDENKDDIDPEFYYMIKFSAMVMGADAICYEDM